MGLLFKTQNRGVYTSWEGMNHPAYCFQTRMRSLPLVGGDESMYEDEINAKLLVCPSQEGMNH